MLVAVVNMLFLNTVWTHILLFFCVGIEMSFPLKWLFVDFTHVILSFPTMQSLFFFSHLSVSDIGMLPGCNPWLSVTMKKNLLPPIETTYFLICFCPTSPFCVCVCVSIPHSIFLLVHAVCWSPSLSDVLPKVETRVVLVGEAGRNGALVKALQVHHSIYLFIFFLSWRSTAFY